MSTIATQRTYGASGLEAMRAALTVPYRGAMVLERIPLDGRSLRIGLAAGEPMLREPMLFVELLKPLADTALVVRGRVGQEVLPELVFAPYSHAESHLPLYRPALAADSEGAGPFTVEIEAFLVPAPEAFAEPLPLGAALPEADAATWVSGLVIGGRLGRLLCLCGLEKQRILRMSREVAATRHLELARGGALDDWGAGLGVPRLLDPPESDQRYRARLRIYSGWSFAAPARFREALNGPGSPGDKNAGLPEEVGVTARFDVVEDTNPLAIGLRLVAVGPQGVVARAALHASLQGAHLFDLDADPPGGLPTVKRERYRAIRARLAATLTRVPLAGSVTPRWCTSLVALALDRVTRLARRLGHTGDIVLERAYDPGGGSRFELGIGCQLRRFTAAELTALGEAVPGVTGQDEVAALARGLQPRTPANDPLGRWLFTPAGFTTVHELDAASVYLSPLPAYGLWVDGPDEVAVSALAQYRGRYPSAGDIGVHPRNEEARRRVAAAFTRRGLGAPPPAEADADIPVRLAELAAQADSPLPPALAELAAAGIVSGTSVAAYASQVKTSAELDQLSIYALSGADMEAVAPVGARVEALAARLDALSDAGFSVARGIWDAVGGRLLVLASVGYLPGATGPGEEPPRAGFRWYSSGIPDTPTALPLQFVRRLGSSATVRGSQPGLALLAVFAYARRGLADPYEVRIELPDGAPLLDREQYAYLMNLLEALYPVGILINTFDIRKRRVDLDGDGQAEWASGIASRTYQRYRQRRAFRFPGGRGAAEGT